MGEGDEAGFDDVDKKVSVGSFARLHRGVLLALLGASWL